VSALDNPSRGSRNRRTVRVRTMRFAAPVGLDDTDHATGGTVVGTGDDETEEPDGRARSESTDVSTVDSFGRRRGRYRRQWTVLTAALLVIGLTALILAGQRWNEHRRLESAHRSAVAAAVTATADFVSISAASVDRDLRRIEAVATGDFKDEFTRGEAQVRAAVVDNAVASTGTVLRAGLVSGSLESAVVLVAVDASITNVHTPQARLSHYRVQVDLVLDRGSRRWLVSRLQFVG
jgi:Mce-associated membrane protein